MDEQSLVVRQGGHTTNRIPQQMNSNRSSNQSQGKAKGKNRPAKKQSSKQRNPPAGQGKLEKAPLAQGRQVRSRAPQMTASTLGNGAIRVKHREYIQDILGSVAFALNSLPVNPGMAATFPWLSTMAQLYESYRFHSLKFEYETQKSASTNGTVLMGVDFDAADTAPGNKQQIMSFEGAVRSGVWQECCYSAKASSLHKFGPEKFNRSAGLAANQDIKTYDAGNFFVATQGCADATAIGELYVEYDIEFRTPQINAVGVLGGSFSSSTAIATATPLGTAGAGTILGSLISGATATVLSLQNLVIGQEYQVSASWTATTITPGATPFVVSGLTLKTQMSSASAVSTVTTVSSTYTATATTATVTPAVTLASGTNLNMLVAPVVISAF